VITCDECGRENDDEYNFCLGCGAELEDVEVMDDKTPDTSNVRCPHCGAEQPGDFKFCGSCGERIPEEAHSESGEVSAVSEPSSPEESVGGEQTDLEETTATRGGEGQRRAGAGASTDGPSMPAGTGEASEPEAGTGGQTDVNQSAVADLIVIRPDGSEGASIPLPDDSISLGRSSNFDVLNEDPFLSPTHATLTHRDGRFMVRDEESLNGVFFRVDGEIELEDGDHIRIGQELMRFRTMGDAEATNDEGTRLAGSPDPGAWGRLELVAGPDVVSRSFALIDDTVTMGREEGKIVFRDDGFVSGTHADIRREDGAYVLRDLNSSNGTYVRIQEERPLREGDLVLMGQQLFRLEMR